jgi:hypothetical protein
MSRVRQGAPNSTSSLGNCYKAICSCKQSDSNLIQVVKITLAFAVGYDFLLVLIADC